MSQEVLFLTTFILGSFLLIMNKKSQDGNRFRCAQTYNEVISFVGMARKTFVGVLFGVECLCTVIEFKV